MKKVMAIASALALALTLAGCAGVALDRTATVGSVTLDVPSSWAQEQGFEGYTKFMSKDEKGSMSVYESDLDYSGKTPDDVAKSMQGARSSDYVAYSNVKNEKIGETVIDGAQVSIYRESCTMTNKETGESFDSVAQMAYMVRGSEMYTIAVIGDSIDIMDVLDTVHLS